MLPNLRRDIVAGPRHDHSPHRFISRRGPGGAARGVRIESASGHKPRTPPRKEVTRLNRDRGDSEGRAAEGEEVTEVDHGEQSLRAMEVAAENGGTRLPRRKERARSYREEESSG